jgi:Mrp family chromosome partitioning ATPase
MEALDLKGALLRGWRLLLLLAVVGALVGAILPSQSAKKTKPTYVASSRVAPVAGKNGMSMSSLETVAQSGPVLYIATEYAGPESAGHFSSGVIKSGAKGKRGKPIAVQLSASAPKADDAAKWANSYAEALGTYLYIQNTNEYTNKVCAAEEAINNLQNEYSQVQSDVTQENNSPGSVSQLPTGSPPDYTQCSQYLPNSDNSNDSDDAFVHGSGQSGTQRAVLTASTPTTTTPPSTKTGNSTSPTTTTVPSNPKQAIADDPMLGALDYLEGDIAQEMQQQITALQGLTQSGPSPAPYSVVEQASPLSAVPVVAKHVTVSSVLSHRSSRVGIGLLAGLILAAGIILLVELTDKTLRTTSRVEETFGFPVVAEIPLWPPSSSKRRGVPPPPRLDVVLSPTSPPAEAYRRLRTALVLEPLVMQLGAFNPEMVNGNGYANGVSNGEPNGYANGYANGHANGYANGHFNGNGHSNGRPSGRRGASADGYRNGNSNGYANGGLNGEAGRYETADVVLASEPGEREREALPETTTNGEVDLRTLPSRQVIMVVSAGREPSRPSVVANLAAVHAEAGYQVLVVSVGELGWRVPRPGTDYVGPDDEITPADIASRSTPSVVQGVRGLALDQVLPNRGHIVTRGPEVIEAARDVADIVIVEAAPLLRSPDGLGLLPAVDVVLAVAEYALTRADDAKKAGSVLRRLGAPVLGVVFTNVPHKPRDPEVAQLVAPRRALARQVPAQKKQPEAPTAELRL